MIEFLLLVLAAGVLMLAFVGRAPSRRRHSGRRDNNRVGGIDREFVARRWAEIQSKASGGALASAVGDADKLLDYALKQSGVRGETMGERLKNSGSRFSNRNGIWSAHKLRNALAHEADFDLVPSMAHEAIANFERGLRDLGAI
jgi:hypothetical protein